MRPVTGIFAFAKGEQFRRGESNVLVAPSRDAKGISPTDISAAILTGLKTRAEIYLGKMVTHAVVGVPAYFNALQRERTKAAAEIAGLKVLRLLSEPMAAATAYGLGVAGSKLVVVVDFGGGTFDVSVLSIVDGTFEALAIGGSNRIGGDALDLALARYCLAKWSLSGIDGDALERLCESCEQAKRTLCVQDTAHVTLRVDGKCYNLEVNLAMFENTIRPLLSECIAIVQQVVSDAGADSKIDEVVLVGGSTQLPLFFDPCSKTNFQQLSNASRYVATAPSPRVQQYAQR